MDAKSKYILQLVRRMPDTLLKEPRTRAPRRTKSPPADTVEVLALKQKLHSIRRRHLEASRRGDYLMEARLRAQAAEIDRAILREKGLPLSLD
jgi:hypothetical protein